MGNQGSGQPVMEAISQNVWNVYTTRVKFYQYLTMASAAGANYDAHVGQNNYVHCVAGLIIAGYVYVMFR